MAGRNPFPLAPNRIMPTTMSRPRTYSPRDIADATGRHPESIRRNLREGDINGHKMGSEWVVTPKALREWLGDDLFEIYFTETEEA